MSNVPAAPAKSRILVVDDEVGNRTMLAGIIEAMGYEPEVACDGYEALAKVKLGFDLVVLDVQMPGMDGFQVTRAIRNAPETASLPIIITTGLAASVQRLHAVEAGANDFLVKPVDFEELNARIAALLEMKRARDAAEQGVQQSQDDAQVLRRLVEENALRERQLYESNVSTVYVLAAAAEYRDDDTAAHIHRMSRYCGVLGNAVGLPPGEVEVLRIASLTHDVGKIGIPDSILLKPGKLTETEFDEMKKHTLIGERILSTSPSELLQAGKVIAISHHEKWDGSGYPHGIQGEAIPLHGRICAVADVFDALTSDRPYKRAFSNDEAFRIIAEGRGKHFDPRLVDAFLASEAEIARIQLEQQQLTIVSNGYRVTPERFEPLLLNSGDARA